MMLTDEAAERLSYAALAAVDAPRHGAYLDAAIKAVKRECSSVMPQLFGHWSKHRHSEGSLLPTGCYVPEGPDYTTVALFSLEPATEPVGWETDAEWVLEQSAFNWNKDWPESQTRSLINELWKQYCLAACPSARLKETQ